VPGFVRVQLADGGADVYGVRWSGLLVSHATGEQLWDLAADTHPLSAITDGQDCCRQQACDDSDGGHVAIESLLEGPIDANRGHRPCRPTSDYQESSEHGYFTARESASSTPCNEGSLG
jgi:hypothetical protein